MLFLASQLRWMPAGIYRSQLQVQHCTARLSVATAQSEGESKKKHVLILEVNGEQFRTINYPLETVRPFVHDNVCQPLSWICSLMHSLTCSLTHLLPRSLTSLTHLTHSLNHSLTDSFAHDHSDIALSREFSSRRLTPRACSKQHVTSQQKAWKTKAPL